MNGWHPIATIPYDNRTVMLYQEGDLYPVIGSRCNLSYFILEEGGPEDSEHRQYPMAIEGYAPQWWRPLPPLPHHHDSQQYTYELHCDNAEHAARMRVAGETR